LGDVFQLFTRVDRFDRAIALCAAFWPGRWLGATLAAARTLPHAFDPARLPEELDRIDRALASVASVNRYLRHKPR
jgi:hypothetical protein